MACLSRFSFRAIPGKTGELEKELKKLRDLVVSVGGIGPKILHTHFASSDAPDIVFDINWAAANQRFASNAAVRPAA